ncbi:MAG: hypothetical protein AB7D36_06785 [Oscillospiraceae bacterium]
MSDDYIEYYDGKRFLDTDAIDREFAGYGGYSGDYSEFITTAHNGMEYVDVDKLNYKLENAKTGQRNYENFLKIAAQMQSGRGNIWLDIDRKPIIISDDYGKTGPAHLAHCKMCRLNKDSQRFTGFSSTEEAMDFLIENMQMRPTIFCPECFGVSPNFKSLYDSVYYTLQHGKPRSTAKKIPVAPAKAAAPAPQAKPSAPAQQKKPAAPTKKAADVGFERFSFWKDFDRSDVYKRISDLTAECFYVKPLEYGGRAASLRVEVFLSITPPKPQEKIRLPITIIVYQEKKPLFAKNTELWNVLWRQYIVDMEIIDNPQGADKFVARFTVDPPKKLHKGKYKAMLYVGDAWRHPNFDNFWFTVGN